MQPTSDSVQSLPPRTASGFSFTRVLAHLLSATPDELHRLRSAQLPRHSFQDHPWRCHYDLPRSTYGREAAGSAPELTMH